MRQAFFLLSIFWMNQSLFANIRVLYQEGSKLGLEFSTNNPKIRSLKIRTESFSKVDLIGAQNDNPPGYPEVPSSTHLIVVPHGTKPVLSWVRGERVNLPLNYELGFLDQIPNHCGEKLSVSKNKQAYLKVYGKNLVDIEEVGFAASEKLARIRVWPFRYMGSKKRLDWAPEIQFEVQFVPETQKTHPVVSSDSTGLAKYLTINFQPSSSKIMGKSDKVDLVIAHISHRETLARYIDFKRSLGREVREFYIENKTNKEIAQMIREQYQASPAPTGTLLVGNIGQIPSWNGSSDNRWTDYPYTVLDSDDYPDIALGRVPAHDSSELNAFIDKAIAREREPRKIEKILLTAGKDESLGCPANVTKVGAKIKESLSDAEIIKKYRTEVDTEEVIAAYNDDPNIVIYDGHGNRQGMTEVPLLISSLKELKNRTYPLVLDIACLNANWGSGPTPRNFAESILLDSQRGAAGIMASGGSGYGHDFFQTIGSIMGKASQDYRTDLKMNQIGQVILAAKIKHGKQDRTYWNYYGDPTSSVWESTLN